MGATMGKNNSSLLDTINSQSTLHIVMLGLDSAGKTTALYRLKFDQYLNTVPTIGFNCEKVKGSFGRAKGIQFLVWDVGGQEKLRPLWRSYTRCTDGIIYVVDSVDVERMEEAKMELMRTAKCSDNQGVPVLILANKQDLPGAKEPRELEKLLGLYELTPAAAAPISGSAIPASATSSATTPSSEQLPATKCGGINSSGISSSGGGAGQGQFKGWFIQPACAITGEGLQEGLDALYDMILRRRKINKANKKKIR